MPIKKNVVELKTDILNSKFDLFVLEFPDLKGELERLKATPNCSGCVLSVFSKMFKEPDFDKKMALIYGDEVSVDKALPRQSAPQVETHNVPIALYDGWISEFIQKNQVRFMTTVYIPETQIVKVTVQSMKMQ